MKEVRIVNERFSIAEKKEFIKEANEFGGYAIYEVVSASQNAIVGHRITSSKLETFYPHQDRKLYWV